MNISTNNYNSTTNHNLSSVLSQIQDNGSAYSDLTKQRYRKQPAAENTQSDELYNDILPVSSSDMQNETQYQTTSFSDSKKEISHGIWLQLLLLLISAVLLASTLFKLDAQTNNIENSLSIYDEEIDEKIQESADLQKQDSKDSTTKLKTALQSLQKELQLIKTDYSDLDKKYIEMAQNNATSEMQDSSTMQDDASTFKYEILSLKSELQTVKDKLRLNNTDNLTSTGNRSLVEVTANNGLIVALASLSNRNKAEKIVKQIYEEGLTPNIQQATVNGERVYRLSVSGFYNRNEAELFIRKADEKYGMKDSRIKNNQEFSG
ncbi:hypothetical protein MNBD_GAMMA06-1942 [hydrothermal vent metagenome]|uniref:SPOR domain-containing protein n=1 Tax=hydrothermal vent metagenome TaxID=652676 RepID=A0A3B0WQT6_9ZZZZ